MINPHIIRKSSNPTIAPPEAGIHWINTLTGTEYFSVGTDDVSDWIPRASSGVSINELTVATVSLSNKTINYANYSGTQNLNLPTASEGQEIVIKTLTNNNVNINPTSGQAIDGDSIVTINREYSTLTLRSFNNNWFIF